METFWKKLAAWNSAYNRIPYKVLLALVVIFAFFICLALLPYIWPFVLGLLLSSLIEPVARLLRRALKKVPLGKTIATIVPMVLLLSLLGFLLILFITTLLTEIKNLANELPAIVNWADVQLQQLVQNFAAANANGVISPEVLTFIDSVLDQLGKGLLNLAGSLTKTIASGAWATATSFPMILLSVLFTIISTYYFSSDKEHILTYFKSIFPQQTVDHTKTLKDNILKALGSQIKAQLTISALITVFLIVGLSIIGISYPHLLGLIIGIADALPIIGAGLFLIPWSLYGFIVGNTSLGLGMAILYIAVGVFRQIIEPKIVGKNQGLNPLATMMTIFIGFKVTGSFLGMLAGPILLNICKVVLTLDAKVHQEKQTLLPGEPLAPLEPKAATPSKKPLKNKKKK